MSPGRLDFDIVRVPVKHWYGMRMATRYVLNSPIIYHSPRYGKTVTVPIGYPSDGASGPATDVVSKAWWVHDQLCTTWEWDDKTPVTAWQASSVLSDILKSEGRGIRARSWFLATWLFGPSPKPSRTSGR